MIIIKFNNYGVCGGGGGMHVKSVEVDTLETILHLLIQIYLNFLLQALLKFDF